MAAPIAITGVGVVSALGVGADAYWEGLDSGRRGVGEITAFDAGGFACSHGGQAPAFSVRDHLPKHYRKGAKVMARDIELAVVAAADAVAMAQLRTPAAAPDDRPTSYPAHRLGTQVGAGLIAADTAEMARALSDSAAADGSWDLGQFGAGGMDRLSPLWMLKYLPNMLACHISILHGARGPSNTLLGGEASGLLSLGEAMRTIERNAADACLAGSGDSRINHLALMRMQLTGRLKDCRHDPDGFRPFDPAAPGQVPGEGAALLVLERPGAADARGARELAHVIGFGCAQAVPEAGGPIVAGQGGAPGAPSDGTGEALARAIARAVEDAGVAPEELDAAFVHAAAHPALDAEEAAALRSALGAHARGIELAWVTPALGECMSATSSLLSAAAALAIDRQRLPARIQDGTPAPGLCAGPAPGRPADLRRVLVCCHGLGGQCAAAVFARPEAAG